jgi:hypothetical protein
VALAIDGKVAKDMVRGKIVGLAAAVFASVLVPAWGAELDANGVPVPTPVSAKAAFHDTSLVGDLAGRWSGQGSALYTDGTTEKLRCVATYIPEDARSGTAGVLGQMQQVIRCKGANMELKLGGAWTIRDGAIAGTWTEETYSLSGKLTGKAVPSGFDLKATSTFADASVAVRLSGCTQDIVMTFTQEVDRMHLALRKC